MTCISLLRCIIVCILDCVLNILSVEFHVVINLVGEKLIL